jgi:hypothetical protein
MPKDQKKKIRFNDNIQTFYIPYEERNGIWMMYAIDRAHFKRRIEHTEKLLQPVLQRKMLSIQKEINERHMCTKHKKKENMTLC